MNELSAREVFIYAALALSAHYFPHPVDDADDGDEESAVIAPFRQAAFFAARKPQAWDRWQQLDHSERRRIADVMALAPAELADTAAFSRAARALLGALDDDLHDDTGDDFSSRPAGPDRLPESGQGHAPRPAGGRRAVLRPFVLVGVPSQAQAARPHVGGDLLGYVDAITARFRRPSARSSPRDFAGPGVWQTREVWITGEGMVHGKLTIPAYLDFTTAPDHSVLPSVVTTDHTPEVSPTVKELLDVALLIDARYDDPADRYLHATLAKLFGALQRSDSDTVDVLALIAGRTQILNAPTGTGKTVLVRVLASWFALAGLRIALVVPDVKATLSTAWDISADLAHLHATGDLNQPATCAPLMSPRRRHERALKHAALIREDDAAPGEWGRRGLRDIDQLAYGCAHHRFLDIAGSYPPGRENCLSLTQGKTTAACPWIPVCGKFAPVYTACDASVIVTNHHHFASGNLQIGVNLDGRPTSGLTVREFTLRTCHAVVIDEIDKFQSTVIDNCATQTVLHSRRHWTAAPQQIDTDAKRAPLRVENSLVSPVSHVRLMAESLLLALCHNALHLTAGDDEATRRPTERLIEGWRLSHTRDRELISLLFPGSLTEGQPIPPERYAFLNALLPDRHSDRIAARGTGVVLDPHWEQVRRVLGDLTAPRGQDYLNLVKLDLHDQLLQTLPRTRDRSRAINLLVVRGYLKELDHAVHTLNDQVQQLRHTSLSSAHRLLEASWPRAVATLLPLGMLGRALTGYRVTGLDNKEHDAELSAQNISGDPHTYVSELGGLVSLLSARVERPVLGLSATAFFPQAVREHIHTPVTWWMTDAQARSIVAQSHTITYGPGHSKVGEPIVIAGSYAPSKRDALIELGTRLYEQKLAKKIERLRRTDPDRARVILTANSYQQCAHLALGLSKAKGFNHRVCVAVRSDDPTRDAKYLPAASLARPITPEEFEDFPAYGDILIAPLAVVARGLNIVVQTRSAVQSIYLCTRPPLTIDEPTWMYASVNAAGTANLPEGGSRDPVQTIQDSGDAAWQQLGLILRSPTQFSAMTATLQEQVIAGMLVNLIQLAGRARRGGTDMDLHLVDYSFQDETWSADLITILQRIHSRWTPRVREQMNDLYGEALGAFLSYAGIDPALV